MINKLEPIEVECEDQFETPKAFCVKNLNDQNVFLAKSQCVKIESNLYKVPEWLAIDKQLV